ncbi:hypothetical protein VP01_1369g3 [Puccinia sorghi]|uniref:Uncharacterized protein n=1 Tax=Puccinia sorghi TaxID=27349 RepID=A0A0L6VLQ2_9BASI|nr:hypothetical protein VP01_1369g3 [Puccinia sorghi]
MCFNKQGLASIIAPTGVCSQLVNMLVSTFSIAKNLKWRAKSLVALKGQLTRWIPPNPPQNPDQVQCLVSWLYYQSKFKFITNRKPGKEKRTQGPSKNCKQLKGTRKLHKDYFPANSTYSKAYFRRRFQISKTMLECRLLTGGCTKVWRLKIIPQLGKPLAIPKGGYKVIT